MPPAAAHPVQNLREHATALEAAFTVCLAEPDKRAVHKLRTEIRRIEAQIAFLKLVRGLPPFRAAAGKLLKQSRKVRRAAGRLRDFDVQHKLIKEEAEVVARQADDPTTLRIRFDDLLTSQEELRAHAAAKLLKLLQKKQAKVAKALERLLETLEPARSRGVSATEMLTLVHGAFKATPALRLKKPSEDDLHTIRKAAKRARYQLESAPGSPSVRKAAKHYEALQDAGGEWHDWLELSTFAERALGQHHRITAAFHAERDRHLHTYQRFLDETRQRLAGRPPAKHAPSQRPAKAAA